jgi:hypothetical protein
LDQDIIRSSAWVVTAVVNDSPSIRGCKEESDSFMSNIVKHWVNHLDSGIVISIARVQSEKSLFNTAPRQACLEVYEMDVLIECRATE